MNRRGFLTSLAALATTAALPKVPAIPLAINPTVYKIALNSMYGKMGAVTIDYRSAYPTLEQLKAVRNRWAQS